MRRSRVGRLDTTERALHCRPRFCCEVWQRWRGSGRQKSATVRGGAPLKVRNGRDRYTEAGPSYPQLIDRALATGFEFAQLGFFHDIWMPVRHRIAPPSVLMYSMWPPQWVLAIPEIIGVGHHGHIHIR